MDPSKEERIQIVEEAIKRSEGSNCIPFMCIQLALACIYYMDIPLTCQGILEKISQLFPELFTLEYSIGKHTSWEWCILNGEKLDLSDPYGRHRITGRIKILKWLLEQVKNS